MRPAETPERSSCRLRKAGVGPRNIRRGVHIGAMWRIRLNYPCAAAMQLYVGLL